MLFLILYFSLKLILDYNMKRRGCNRCIIPYSGYYMSSSQHISRIVCVNCIGVEDRIDGIHNYVCYNSVHCGEGLEDLRFYGRY
jgi:hypothetical protein